MPAAEARRYQNMKERVTMRPRTILFVLPIFLACNSAEKIHHSADPMATLRTELVRKTFEGVSPGVLGIVEPIEIVKIESYKGLLGGGSLTIKDATGKEFCYRSGPAPYDCSSMPREVRGDPICVRDYIRICAVDSSNCSFVPPGYDVRGPEEAALFGLLIRWEQENVPDSDIWHLSDVEIHKSPISVRAHHFLRGLDWRFGGYPAEEAVWRP